MIVEVLDLKTHMDDRGDLTELVHVHELANHQFGQVYCVRNERPEIIRAFHRHRELWDYFTIVHGKAMFWFVTGDNQDAQKVVLGAHPMQLIIVPPTVWHGWMSLVPDTILISTASHVYDHNNPDEERIPHDHFSIHRPISTDRVRVAGVVPSNEVSWAITIK